MEGVETREILPFLGLGLQLLARSGRSPSLHRQRYPATLRSTIAGRNCN
jgi:hypothetical protein